LRQRQAVLREVALHGNALPPQIVYREARLPKEGGRIEGRPVALRNIRQGANAPRRLGIRGIENALALDYPFTGDVQISRAPFEQSLQEMPQQEPPP
jgi:hypothetical protein